MSFIPSYFRFNNFSFSIINYIKELDLDEKKENQLIGISRSKEFAQAVDGLIASGKSKQAALIEEITKYC